MIRRLVDFFRSQERQFDPETYDEAVEMLLRLESANHRLAAVVTAHNDYLKFISRQTDRDHMLDFDVFFLSHKNVYGPAPADAFKHRRII